jgi:allantoin racemase
MSGLDRQMEEALGVPVIDAVAAAVKLAESLIGLQKFTSKQRTYRYPELKALQGYPAHFHPQALRCSRETT